VLVAPAAGASGFFPNKPPPLKRLDPEAGVEAAVLSAGFAPKSPPEGVLVPVVREFRASRTEQTLPAVDVDAASGFGAVEPNSPPENADVEAKRW
jgi:hypothetical protein